MLRKWTDWANVAAAMVLGAYLLILGLFAANAFALIPEVIRDNGLLRLLSFLVGAALVGLNAWLLRRAYGAGGLRDSLRLAAADGANLVSPDALEALFLRTIKNEPDIRQPRVALEVKSGQTVAVHLRFGLREQADVVKRMERIKALVRDRFARMLPEGVNLEIYVEVVELMADDGSAGAFARETPPKEFDGPVYSDDEAGGDQAPA